MHKNQLACLDGVEDESGPDLGQSAIFLHNLERFEIQEVSLRTRKHRKWQWAYLVVSEPKPVVRHAEGVDPIKERLALGVFVGDSEGLQCRKKHDIFSINIYRYV